jgi:hypothetical protein
MIKHALAAELIPVTAHLTLAEWGYLSTFLLGIGSVYVRRQIPVHCKKKKNKKKKKGKRVTVREIFLYEQNKEVFGEREDNVHPLNNVRTRTTLPVFRPVLLRPMFLSSSMLQRLTHAYAAGNVIIKL